MRRTLLLVALLSSACAPEPYRRPRDTDGAVVPYQGEVATDNKNFSVGRLFVHEGYAVYRFYDGGTAIYYATPMDAAAEKTVSTTAHWQTQHIEGVAGKGGHYVIDEHQVMTVTAAAKHLPFCGGIGQQCK